MKVFIKETEEKNNAQEYNYLTPPVLVLEKSRPRRDGIERHEYMGGRWELVDTILAPLSLQLKGTSQFYESTLTIAMHLVR